MTDHEPRFRYWGSRDPQASFRGIRCESGADKTAAIKLYDPIDSWGAPYGVSAKEFGAALDSLPDSTEAITVHIHSPGGDAFDGIAIMNQLRQHKATVNVVVDGLAASAASYIAVGGGDTLTMAPNAQLMIHDASGLAIGQAADMKTMADALDTISQNIASVYADKAGGSVEDWRAAMQPESWYTAEEAVEAKLADRVLPKGGPAKAPTDRFDLSIFAHAGRSDAPEPFIPAAKATETPAEPPVTPSTEHEEADDMSDTLTKGLRERLGVADDADEATILAALDEALAEQTEQPSDQPTVPEGHTVISADALEELRIAARAGQEARAVQLREDRDRTIAAAINAGHIAPARREHWAAKWDADPEGVRASIAELSKGEPIFPVAQAPGYAGAPEVSDEDKLYADLFGDEKAGV